MSMFSSWCLLCSKEDASVTIKHLNEDLQNCILDFSDIKPKAPKKICTDCDKFIRLYGKRKAHYQKVQEMYKYATGNRRKTKELIDLREKFKVDEELEEMDTEELHDSSAELYAVKEEHLEMDELEDLICKAEPMSPQPDSPADVPFFPQLSPEPELPDNFEDFPCLEAEDSDSGGLSDHFEFTGTKKRIKDLYNYPKLTYECDLCGFTICWKGSFIRHMNRKHIRLPDDFFKCEKCPKAYNNREALRVHFARKHKNQPLASFDCHLCERKFVTRNVLSYHVLSVHVKRRDHQCSKCSKMFLTRGAMVMHEKSHVTTKDFLCTVCPKKMATAEQLRRHLQRHNSIPTFCDICGSKVVSDQQLKKHKEFVHSGKVAHTCIVCGRQFSRMEKYKEHLIAIHTDLRPYTCRYCDRTFNNGPNYAKHKRETHPEEFAEEKKCLDTKGTRLPSIMDLHARIQANLE